MTPIVWKTFPLDWRQWGDDIVVYNQSSGNTHLVSSPTARILSLLESHPSSVFEIAEEIAAKMQLVSDADIIESVDSVLRKLEDLGLVEPLSP